MGQSRPMLVEHRLENWPSRAKPGDSKAALPTQTHTRAIENMNPRPPRRT